ncbi:MAG: DUF4350 domain-containing protein [Candidatus Symbiothrix sp.]|jgi:hypothetical protein|nr:DUF4350 domain-containing protein [Candidatus Symbiothrix sp.]
MKKRIIYIVFIGLLFYLAYRMNRDAAVEYSWQPTFSIKDKQPFGAYAFDKMLKASWEEEYVHNYDRFEDLDLYNMSYNVLIVARYLYMDSNSVNDLLAYVRKGGRVLIAAEFFPPELTGILNLNASYFNYIYYHLPSVGTEEPISEVRLFVADSLKKSIPFPKKLIRSYFTAGDSLKAFHYWDSTYIVSESKQGDILSLRYQIGEGNLILCSCPLAFTNYGMLRDSLNVYTLQHLSYLRGKPLIRTEYYEAGSQGEKEESALRVLTGEKPLKWALCVTMAGVLILMVFTARRKQKPIPVIKPPVNKIMGFVRSIAGLYLQKNNNADIILKKQIYWGEELKHKYGIDTVNEAHDYDFYKRVASKTGYPDGEVRRLFLDLGAIEEDTNVTDEEMMKLITKMNEIQWKNQ